MQATWRISGLYKADANAVATELSAIKCTPENIVEYAKDESSELHKCFEWDDSIAGYKYRCIQAQHIVRSLVVVEKEEQKKTPLRLFYNTGDGTGEYKPVKVVMQDQDEYQALLQKAKNELIAFREKYKFLAELDEIMTLIDLL